MEILASAAFEVPAVDNQVPFKVAPVLTNPDGTSGPSSATLTGLVFTVAPVGICTVAPDPNNADGAIATRVPAGNGQTAVITATATAHEPDGKTLEVILGTVQITFDTPQPPVATGLVFVFGTPTP